MIKKHLAILSCFLCTLSLYAQKTYTVISPDGHLKSTVSVGKTLTYDIALDGRIILAASPVSVTTDKGDIWGKDSRIAKVSRTSTDETVPSPLYRTSSLRNCYNSLTLGFKGDWSIEFRAYNDGIAYRFANTAKRPFNIINEQVEYIFPEDFEATVPYVRGNEGNFEAQFRNSFENTYSTARISGLDKGRMAFLPLSADAGEGVKICITEVNLNNYPGLYLTTADAAANGLKGMFAPYPKLVEQGGHNRLQMVVKEREGFIAKVEGPRSFPWRAAVVSKSDKELAASDLNYLLAEPSRIEDMSWIRPGKVAWEWWNDWNISGVDFETGVNDATYKAYIDFASSKGIGYVILDEGWAVNLQADLMQVVPEIHLQELVDYAAERNVGIILWAGYWAFDRDMENVCRHYSEMGVKGFKVDFMDRDDQLMTAFNYRAAEMAAKYKLILDLHGTHKPAGITRTWPNVLNCEGVHGLETMKWSPESVDQMEYDAHLPFLRQVAGPMDYTQGAMLNAAKGNFNPVYSEPMSQGTRCHQLALYAVLDSPLNMLCDSPSNYMREPESTDFIAGIPTVWDETRILDGEMGDYIVTARRTGNTWYVGGITDWTARDLSVDLSFIGKGEYEMTIFRDGANAHRKGTDYRLENISGSTARPFSIHLAPGGGFVLKITPKE